MMYPYQKTKRKSIQSRWNRIQIILNNLQLILTNFLPVLPETVVVSAVVVDDITDSEDI
jgi:hypothetical protein